MFQSPDPADRLIAIYRLLSAIKYYLIHEILYLPIDLGKQKSIFGSKNYFGLHRLWGFKTKPKFQIRSKNPKHRFLCQKWELLHFAEQNLKNDRHIPPDLKIAALLFSSLFLHTDSLFFEAGLSGMEQ